MTEYITVKLTRDQIDTIIFEFEKLFYNNMTPDNQYAHFCHRVSMAMWKAKKLGKAKS